MYQMNNGEWYNYPDLIAYLRNQEDVVGHATMKSNSGVVPEAKHIGKDDFQAYGYAPKT